MLHGYIDSSLNRTVFYGHKLSQSEIDTFAIAFSIQFVANIQLWSLLLPLITCFTWCLIVINIHHVISLTMTIYTRDHKNVTLRVYFGVLYYLYTLHQQIGICRYSYIIFCMPISISIYQSVSFLFQNPSSQPMPSSWLISAVTKFRQLATVYFTSYASLHGTGQLLYT